MSTQAAVIIGVAVLAGAFIVAQSLGGPPPAAQEAHSEAADTPAPVESAAPPTGLTGASTDEAVARLTRALEAERRRIAELEARLGEKSEGESAPEEAASTPAKQADRVLELVRKYASGTASREEVGELLALSRNKGLMARVVAGLESKIAEDPDDVAARMQLAEIESARVHGAESITERAMLAKNVRTQIDEVLRRDPENWEARYMRAVGISHSQRTPQGRATAIREFESLIALQESRPAEPRHAQAYGELARVLVAEKDVERARQALQAGLARHPGDEDLRKQMESLPK